MFWYPRGIFLKLPLFFLNINQTINYTQKLLIKLIYYTIININLNAKKKEKKMSNKPESKKMVLTVGGKTVEVETGKYAKQATSSVTVRCGNTMLFVHATVSKEPRVGIDFFPLLIDYEERMSAIGKIPGGYTRTEGRSSEKAILISRLIDRPIRPLWPKGYRNDVQIVSQ